MSDSGMLAAFIIAAFSFGFVLNMKKNTVPEKMRRPLAITAIFLIVAAFILLVYSLFTM